MKVQTILAAASVGVVAASPLKELQYQAIFSKWTKEHGKQYDTKDVFAKYATFKANHQLITEENAKGHSYTLAVNQFADLTSAEFKALYTGFHQPKSEMERSPVTVSHYKAANTTIDWRTKGAVTPVKNQGQCGSCWAFSTVASTEGGNFVANGELVSLTEQQLVDCAGSEGNQGCNGGLMDNGFKWIKDNGGIGTEESYPYTAKDGTCQKVKSVVQVNGFTDVTVGDESALMEALQGHVISVAIEADQSGFQFYSSGVFDGSCGTQLDHGVTLVAAGTDSGKDYWTIKNSWGASWGESGYIRFVRGKNQCGLANAASYPHVVAATPTPPPAPTPKPAPTPAPQPTPSPKHEGYCALQSTEATCDATEQSGKDCNWCDYSGFKFCTNSACASQ